jgi:hypothetical protein
MSDKPRALSIDKARRLRRFRPREALLILSKMAAKDHAFLKIWALARLLAWATLDQRAGTRPSKKDGDAERRKRSGVRTRNAQQVGHLILASLLEQQFQSRLSAKSLKTLSEMFALFMIGGGFGVFVRGRGARAILSQAKAASEDLRCVHRIVKYMCRYHKYGNTNSDKFAIESAKEFVLKYFKETGKGSSKISKIWEKYKTASPHIFSIYPIWGRLKRKRNFDGLASDCRWLCADKRRLEKLIGRAAYAADVMNLRARDVRVSDFKGVPRIAPRLLPFTEQELKIIEEIDRNAAIP